jgi:DNA-binding MarR family transcriptional regulator
MTMNALTRENLLGILSIMEADENSLAKRSANVHKLAKQLGLRSMMINQFFGQYMELDVLTYSQASVLALLLNKQPLRLTDLATALHVRPPSMTELVSRMEQQGWVQKSSMAHDRRGVEVTLTEKGKALIQALERKQLGMLSQRIALLSDEGREAVERALPLLDQLFRS